jgi:hypothetical protein
MSNPLSGALIKSGLSISRRVIPNGSIPILSQEKTLRSLLKKASTTQFGNKYAFQDLIKSESLFEDYRSIVPIHDYDKMFSDWWYKNLEGEEDVSWKGKINYFALSSGTTGAPSKYIPITKEMIRSIRLAGVKTYAGLTISDLPIQQYSRKVLMLGGNADLKREKHYFYGDLSGILVHQLPVWMTSRYKPGLKIAGIKDYHEKMLAIAKEAPTWDIGFLSGIPSWIQMMLEYTLEYNRISNIHEIWPNLQVYAHGGIAMGPYKDSIQSMMGRPLIYLDTYLASEGFVAYQNRLDAKGMTLNYNCGMYYEFVPFNSDNFDSQGNILSNAKSISIDKVTEGVEYAILLSTCAGSWRYHIGDTVKFVDLDRSEIILTGRTKHFLSICGEHLSVDNMNEAILAMQENLKIKSTEFTVAGIQSGSKYSHKWYISSEPLVYNNTLISKELDLQLKRVNDDYAAVRKAVLDPPTVISLPPSMFFKYLEFKGKSGGQSKFPRVMSTEQFADWESFVQTQQPSTL